MSALQVTSCRSCRAPVVFVPSAKSGRPMILDAKPGKAVVVVDLETAQKLQPLVALGPFGTDQLAVYVDAYTDHHATCPAAKAWQGRNRTDPPVGVRS